MKLNEQLLKIKKNIKFDNFKIDVGTSIDAPNSAHWLLKDNSVFVLGIEPNITNVNILKNGSHKKPKFNYINANSHSILKEDMFVKNYEPERFSLLEKVAIDNVDKVIEENFYCTSEINTGCSSLFKPSSLLEVDVERIDKVEVASLEYILDSLDFPKDGHIMFVKTDTQGKDFDVVKSLRKYLKNVVALKCEYNTMNQYENKENPKEFIAFMQHNGFILVNHTSYDFFFYNSKFSTFELFNLPAE